MYFGLTKKELWTWEGEQVGSVFGSQLPASSQDVNGDQIPDVAIAAGHYDLDATNTNCGRVYVYAGNDLFLTASPSMVSAGQVLTLTSKGGIPLTGSYLFVAAVNGLQSFLPVDGGGFYVPSGLAGTVIVFQAMARDALGGIIDSNQATVQFQ